jgi:sarcosine oxidase subunit delta
VYEFRFGGEVKERPAPEAPDQDWLKYTHTRVNQAGVQNEWWFHRSGCQQWLLAVRNTVTNEVLQTSFPE